MNADEVERRRRKVGGVSMSLESEEEKGVRMTSRALHSASSSVGGLMMYEKSVGIEGLRRIMVRLGYWAIEIMSPPSVRGEWTLKCDGGSGEEEASDEGASRSDSIKDIIGS